VATLPIGTAKFTGDHLRGPTLASARQSRDRTTQDRPRDGRTVFQVGLFLMSGATAEVVNVDVPGEPSDVQLGMPVQVRNLVAVPWENDGRLGIAFPRR
jgi:hypothetical protein